MVEVRKNKYGYYSVVNTPSEKELEEYYANKYYQNANGCYEVEYDDDEILYFKNKIAERVFVIEQHLSISNSRNFLDIGCGEGWALAYFKKKGWKVTGLDYSIFGCEKFNPDCKSNLIAGNIYENLAKLVVENSKYSVVWLDNVLEHVTNPEILLKEIKKIIEVGGILVVEVPNDFSLIQKHLVENSKVENEYWIITPDHLSYFNKDGLNSLLSDCGYLNIEIISDYPIDINLLNPNSNYIKDKSKGKACHRERIDFENLIHLQPIDDVINYYRASANLGIGRQLIGFYKLQ